MSDIMLIGVLGMPMPDNPADLDAITYLQFVSRARQAAEVIERRTEVLRKIAVHTDAAGIDDLRLPHAKRMLALAHNLAVTELEGESDD